MGGTASRGPASELLGRRANEAASREHVGPSVPSPGTLWLLGRLYMSPAETEKRRVKLAIWRSVLILSIATFVANTGYVAVTAQHLHIEQSMGTLVIGIIAGVTALSAMFLPVLALHKIGHKTLLEIGLVSITIYCGALFYPFYYTTVIVAVLMGLQATFFSTAAASYIARSGEKYAELGSEDREVCVTTFFATFYTLYQLSVTIGYVIGAEVFPQSGLGPADLRGDNDYNIASVCGFRFCSFNETSDLILQPRQHFSTDWIILTGITFGLSLVAAFMVAHYVLSLTALVGNWRAEFREPSYPSSCDKLLAPLKQGIQPYQLLLLPVTLWAGAQQAYLLYVFTRGFVACGVGNSKSDYVALTYACSSALCSCVSGYIVKHLGRGAMFLSASFMNFSMILLMLNWVPLPEHFPLYFIVAVIWGVADAVWHIQLSALYAAVFPLDQMEAVFSSFVALQAIGFLSVFLTHSLLCVDATIYILLMLLFSGTIGYLCIEIVEKKRYGAADSNNIQPLP